MKALFFTAVLVFVWLVPPSHSAEKLTILHSSEHHGVAFPLEQEGNGSVGGLAGRASVIEEIRRETSHVLVVDSGDILIGTALSSWFRGEPDIKAMNLMGYHAMGAGNHDFDYGLSHLQNLQTQAKFPILCTNLQAEGFELPCQSSTIVHVGHLRVGLLGVVGRSNFPDTFNRDVIKVLSLQDPQQAVKEQVSEWENNQLVDVVVVISHQDTLEDRQLLEAVQELDIIVGGHTEGFDGLLVPGMDDPVEISSGPVRVFVKTHRQGRTLGRLDVQIDRGNITWARARNIPITQDIASDLAVQQLLSNYKQRFSSQAHEIVGRALIHLEGEREQVRTGETNLGNLLADLMRVEFAQQIALINSGQIRASIPAGPVTLGRVMSVLPFDSSMVTLVLTGEQLLSALENSASMLPGHGGRFLQVSGLQVTYDAKGPLGNRVQGVKVEGKPLDLQHTYSIVTVSFLADGGDGFLMFHEAAHRIDHQTPIRDLLLKALAEQPLKAEKEGRIRFLHSPSSSLHSLKSSESSSFHERSLMFPIGAFPFGFAKERSNRSFQRPIH